LGTVIGVRDVPLIYVLRDDEIAAAAMALLTDKPFSEIHGSVRAELNSAMIVRRSFNFWKKPQDVLRLLQRLLPTSVPGMDAMLSLSLWLSTLELTSRRVSSRRLRIS